MSGATHAVHDADETHIDPRTCFIYGLGLRGRA